MEHYRDTNGWRYKPSCKNDTLLREYPYYWDENHSQGSIPMLPTTLLSCPSIPLVGSCGGHLPLSPHHFAT